jgi:hypothetical protein
VATHDLITALGGKLQNPIAGISPVGSGHGQAAVPAPNAPGPATPTLTIFSGYLGEPWDDGTTTWQPLFFDAVMSKGMLVDANDIEVEDSRKDDAAAFGKRDYIWVQVEKSIHPGYGPPAAWLNGPFTRAGDFAASYSGGTIGPQGGILREATTPTCCGIRSR